MLLELRIENLLLIERAELRLGPGLNAITGETGAGKTILAHSLDLIMGGKARSQIVRPGAPEAYVEGVFEIPEGLLEDPELADVVERLPSGTDEIVLGRRVSASGRTSAFLQGRSATAAELRALGSRLLAFYGQHEHRKLTLAAAQLETLDGFAGPEQAERLAAYRESHREVVAIEAELAELSERQGGRERDLDLLRFELSEIEAAEPDPAEEAELAPERERLRHGEALRGAAAYALEAVEGSGEGGAAEALAQAESSLSAQEGVDPALDELATRAQALTLEARELAAELRAYAEGVEAEPGRLQLVEERLEVLDRLKRKHGGSVDAVIEHAEVCRAMIEEIDGADERNEALEGELAAARELRAGLAAELTAAREGAAVALEGRVEAELEQLAMNGAKLEVVLEPHPEGFGPSGSETVELRVATNPGMPVAPLRDSASGGELSRVMLALAGQGAKGGDGTLVFDEIDAGIGGSTARAVGERLRALGTERQVLCITHLPQVASMAATHFSIEKDVGRDPATAEVRLVDGDELVAEIVRMMGAERGDKTAGRHARELLQAA